MQLIIFGNTNANTLHVLSFLQAKVVKLIDLHQLIFLTSSLHLSATMIELWPTSFG